MLWNNLSDHDTAVVTPMPEHICVHTFLIVQDASSLTKSTSFKRSIILKQQQKKEEEEYRKREEEREKERKQQEKDAVIRQERERQKQKLKDLGSSESLSVEREA